MFALCVQTGALLLLLLPPQEARSASTAIRTAHLDDAAFMGFSFLEEQSKKNETMNEENDP
jgi:hypothetical protein